jgi:outer membrane lipoprotein-sorting protein
MILLSVAGFASGGPAAERAPTRSQAESPAGLQEVLRRFDEAQAAVRTLRAAFEEVKEVALLEKPLASRGTLFYVRPNDILWEYAEPSPRSFLIREERLLAYYPAERRAEQLDISRFRGRLQRWLGIGQASKDLKKAYEISLAGETPPGRGPELILSPRRRQVRKRLAEIRFRLDVDSHLPVRLQYTERDGDRTIISFKNIEVNRHIDEAVFRIDLPPDVTVEEGFTGLGPVGEGS